jgi:hypothetical protein
MEEAAKERFNKGVPTTGRASKSNTKGSKKERD